MARLPKNYFACMPRLFVAVDIPERIKDDIIATYSAMPGARWIDEPNLHLTLKFIGDVPGDIAERTASVLREVTGSPFSMCASKAGFFPPRKEPRILWVGLTESEELLRLQARVERTLTAIGIEPEERKFHPHITVARLSGTPAGRVADYVTRHSLFLTEPFPVDAFHLYTSYLRREGAIHEKVKSYELAASFK